MSSEKDGAQVAHCRLLKNGKVMHETVNCDCPHGTHGIYLNSQQSRADAFGISRRTMQKADDIVRSPRGSELRAKIVAKEISLEAAWREATGRPKKTVVDQAIALLERMTTDEIIEYLERSGLGIRVTSDDFEP
jgi:hypothetical protein